MSFVLALAAFAAIVTVYSTVVTVLVEGVHKLFALRSSGMTEMLRAFYDEKLAHLQPDDTPEQARATAEKQSSPSKQARAFADAMTRNDKAQSLKFWYLRKWPLIGALMPSRAQTLSTLQFVERLAETPEGAALAKHTPERLRSALSAAAYQYERMGEAQGAYFRSRAKMISVLLGIIVAAVINFDAITVYKELSTNSELSSRLTLALDQERLQIVRNLSEGGDMQDATSAAAVSGQLKSMTSDIRTLGLPIGRKMFPHCENYFLSRQDAGPTKPPSQVGDPGTVGDYVDARCGSSRQDYLNKTWSTTFPDYLKSRNALGADLPARIGHWIAYRAERVAVIGRNLETFAMWALGVLVAGGLLGLGAPFWYQLFGRVSAIASPVARAALAGQARAAVAQAPDIQSVRAAVRHPESSAPDELEHGYLTVLSGTSPVLSASRTAPAARNEPAPRAEPASGRIEDAPPGAKFGERPPETGRV